MSAAGAGPARIGGEGAWALVLGASSGMGAAAAIRLARDGFDICGVHLDRRATQPLADAVRQAVENAGRRALFFNRNAASQETRDAVTSALREATGGAPRVHVLLHSVAMGVLRPLLPPLDAPEGEDGPAEASEDDLRLTVEVMGNDLVHWTRALVRAGLLGRPARILALTSEGSLRALPSYGPVSAAKAALEAHVRQLAIELAPRGATALALMAGVTDTPALRRIPGWEKILTGAALRNPHGRLTTPDDVAALISLLCDERAGWVSGSVVRVDGAETAAC